MTGPFGPNNPEGRDDPTQHWGGQQQQPGQAGPTQHWGGQPQTPSSAQPTQHWEPTQPPPQQQWGQQPQQPPQWGQQGQQPQWGQQSQPHQQWGHQQPTQQEWNQQQWGQQQPWSQGQQQLTPQRAGKGKGLVIALVIGGIAIVAAVIGLVLALTAKDKLDQAAVQEGVKKVLSDSYGIQDVAEVSCPSGQEVKVDATFTCDLKVSGEQKKVTVKITKDDGTYEVGRPN